eukprot:TRINITY_DN62365_c0_g1_i1.p1 TRINITY_DN62365_c0_g1~~TRINITY_DN62365_c0_g1_i1.p1  ORF type:complete len:429 (+),score=41.94 TRINITY_DN62365_c0_g1_i1:23-1288(+)
MKIIIAGGGLSGLGLAALLGDKYEVVVFERDSGIDSRFQGYSIAVREDAICKGITSLKRMKVWDDCVNVWGSPLSHFTFASPDGAPIKREVAAEKGKTVLRIQRGELRKALLQQCENLPNVTIRWSSKVTAYSQTADTVTATLSDGTTEQADLLVAADGSASIVRNQMKGDQLVNTSIIGFMGMCNKQVDHELLRKGFSIAVGEGVMCLCTEFRFEGQWVNMFLIVMRVTQQEYNSKGWRGKQPGQQQMKDELLSWVKQKRLGGPVSCLIEQSAAEDIYLWHCADRDPISNWREGRVVLVGDAAHPTTPFAGAGANNALEDSLVLFEELTREGQQVDEAIDQYMARRVGPANHMVSLARSNGERLVSTGKWELLWARWFPSLSTLPNIVPFLDRNTPRKIRASLLSYSFAIGATVAALCSC